LVIYAQLENKIDGTRRTSNAGPSLRTVEAIQIQGYKLISIYPSIVGIGMKSSHDDDWIAHQDSFNALLSSLNSGKVNYIPYILVLELE